MESTALLSVIGGAFLLSIIYVTGLCINCWGRKQPTSITQRYSDSSPEYNPTPGFVVRSQYPASTYMRHPDGITTIQCTNYQLPISLSSPSIAVKQPSCPPSETGSQASYVNQNGEEGINIHVDYYDAEEEYVVSREDPNYIEVIPDSPHAQRQEFSRASSQSSGENYINIEKEDENNSVAGIQDEDSDSDANDYINLRNSGINFGNQTPVESYGSINSDDPGSFDYVNTDPKLL